MRRRLVSPTFTLAIVLCASLASAQQPRPGMTASETRIPVGTTSLYARTIGAGPPVIVLHGGPDFDISYLLPELDALADTYRLIYYDQRGRGKSAEHVRAEDVTLASDIDDVDHVIKHFQLDSPVLLGHSWGAVLAVEYALRHPTRVSRLILLNPAPLSSGDLALLRTSYLAKLGSAMDRQREILRGAAYQQGDPAAVIARYRIHFTPALVRREDYEQLMARMQAAFEQQGSEGILTARAVETQLMHDTWDLPTYDLLPRLRGLKVPTVVITGDQDFIPVDVARHIAEAMPNARLVTIPGCGHFAYMECGADVRKALVEFFK